MYKTMPFALKTAGTQNNEHFASIYTNKRSTLNTQDGGDGQRTRMENVGESKWITTYIPTRGEDNKRWELVQIVAHQHDKKKYCRTHKNNVNHINSSPRYYVQTIYKCV